MKTPLHPRAGRAATIATATVLLASCSSSPGSHTTPRRAASRTPATNSASAETMLPLSPADLAAAIRVATGFAAAYATYSYTEPPRTYLARLRPTATPELYATLARGATTPGLLSRRTRDHETATAQARPEQIRTIGPSSLILLLKLRQAITTSTGSRQHTEHLAITATKTASGAWQISDVEPASAGDAGNENATHASAR